MMMMVLRPGRPRPSSRGANEEEDEKLRPSQIAVNFGDFSSRPHSPAPVNIPDGSSAR